MNNWKSIAVKVAMGIGITLATLMLVKKVEFLRRLVG